MRNVVVTGGSRGIGLAVTQLLAHAGYRVIVVSRSLTADLSASREAAKAGSGAIEFRACDLADLPQIAPLVRNIKAEFGAPFGLVNNAALGTAGLLSNMHDQDLQRLIQLNTVAPIMLSKYVVRAMMLQREGRIINMASIVAATGYGGLSVYSATKASLIGFTRSLAREVGGLGITVNAISPGFVDTEMTHDLSDAQRSQIARRSALQRLPQPVDIAKSVEFLLGEGGRNITGTVFTVDAGNTA